MGQWTMSVLFKVMACHLFGAETLPEPVLTYCQWDPRNKLQWNLNQYTKKFIHENTVDNVVCEMAAILSNGSRVQLRALRKPNEQNP